ncbi:MAG: Dam family site-specific DNA-(adenine-N6)-methyltransferase [Defluviitaleaceae bacterium]|nr:Dam family site-specific DNA-(adenine-N6)-methyltransferase [Defluviitaleaceae bacterium]
MLIFADMLSAKPFVKWAGGKGQLLGEIRKKYPAELGIHIKKYAEPFVGGGAVLFDILNNFKLDEFYISDINKELINAYVVVRDSVDALIDVLFDFQNKYISSSEERRKEFYYDKREKYNALKKVGYNTSVEIAALFIFLNRTCFNGLYRVNSKGNFNVPQGKYNNPSICDEKNLAVSSKKLQRVNIVHSDYKLSTSFIDDKTFVYFDPPYRPLSSTSSFTFYSENGFCDNKQIDLAKFINEMSERGAYILASNSDPKNTDEGDDFFERLYANHQISRIEASRAINSNRARRGKINELLIASI